jgi:hypothetical protein
MPDLKAVTFLILISGDGKTYLYQIFTSSSAKMISAKATALSGPRPVISASLSYHDCPPSILAFSRLELISLLATAHPITRAVLKRRIDLR